MEWHELAMEALRLSADNRRLQEEADHCRVGVVDLDREVERLRDENERLTRENVRQKDTFPSITATMEARDRFIEKCVKKGLAQEARRILDSAPVIHGDNQLLARLLSEHLEFELRKLVDQGEKEE